MTWKLIVGILIGAAAGFGVGYLMRCAGGGCPLTCNPYISTILGALLGAMATLK